MNIVSEAEKAYLAGFIDGEGCLTVTNSGAVLIIVSTNLEVLKKIKKCLGIGNIKSRKIKSKKAKRYLKKSKISYHYRISGQNLENLLGLIQPFLIIKKEQAKLLLNYYKTVNRTLRG